MRSEDPDAIQLVKRPPIGAQGAEHAPDRGPEVRQAGVVGEGDEIDIPQRIPRQTVRTELPDHGDPPEPLGELCDEDREGALGIGAAVLERVVVIGVYAEPSHRARILARPGGAVALVG